MWLTISGKGLEALVVSKETQKTGKESMKKRQKAGLAPLEIVRLTWFQLKTILQFPQQGFEVEKSTAMGTY